MRPKGASEKGGINKVKMGKGYLEKGQHGKMHNKPDQKAVWKRPNKANTPRPA